MMIPVRYIDLSEIYLGRGNLLTVAMSSHVKVVFEDIINLPVIHFMDDYKQSSKFMI